jgi:hypothetical protein
MTGIGVMEEVKETEVVDDVSHLSDEELDQVIEQKDDAGEASDDGEKSEDNGKATASVKGDSEDNGKATAPDGEEKKEDSEDSGELAVSDEEESGKTTGEDENKPDYKILHENAQEFIHRQANELGEIRRELAELKKKPQLSSEEVRELYERDPKAAINAVLKEKEGQTQDDSDRKARAKELNRKGIMKLAPDFTEYVPDIVALAKADGEKDEVLDDFKQSPLDTNVYIAAQFYRRAKLTREFKKLEQENKDLKKKLKEFPNKIKQTVNAKGKTIAGQPPAHQTTALNAVTDEDISNLSDEQLDEYIAEH